MLIRLGVFVLTQNTPGVNKAVQDLFIMLHLVFVHLRVVVSMCVVRQLDGINRLMVEMCLGKLLPYSYRNWHVHVHIQ